jgi:multiple sugar transport system substrate-binding protein
MTRADRRNSTTVSRRAFLLRGGVGLAGAALLPACTDYVRHVGSGFTGAETVGADTLVFAHGPERSGTLAKLIDEFNKSNGKGIKVQWREMPADSGQYFDKLRTEFQAGGGGVDVMSGDITWSSQFAANGWIQDLSDLFTEDMRSEYLGPPLQANTYKGTIFGVPWFTDAGMFYYRKDLLEKAGARNAPTNWDEVIDISRKLVEEGSVQYGLVFQGAEYEGGVCNGSEYIWNAGGELLDPNDLNRVVIGSSEAERGLETERMFVAEGIASEGVAVYKEQETDTAFLGGSHAFARNWPYMLGLAADPAISSLKPEQIGLTQLPVVKAGDTSFNALGGWNFFINASSKRKEQAWEFIRFMSEDSTQKAFAIDGALLPTKKAIYEDREALEKQPTVEVAKEATTNSKPRPIHPFYSDMSLVLSEGFNESLKGAQSPSRAINGIEREMKRIAEIGTNVYDLGESGGGPAS